MQQAVICLLLVLGILPSSLGAYGGQCTSGTDCDANEQCSKIADCPKGTCVCQTDFLPYGTPMSCKVPGPKKLGEQCNAVEDCYSFALLGSFIVECATTCNCKSGFTRMAGTDYCISTVTPPTYANKGEQCTPITKECFPGLNLQCGTTSRTCDCPTDTEWASVYPSPSVCLHKNANPNRVSAGNTCTPRYSLNYFNSDSKVCVTSLDCITCPGETTSKCGNPLPSIVGTGSPKDTTTLGRDQTSTVRTDTTTSRMTYPPWGNAAAGTSVAFAAILFVLTALL